MLSRPSPAERRPSIALRLLPSFLPRSSPSDELERNLKILRLLKKDEFAHRSIEGVHSLVSDNEDAVPDPTQIAQLPKAGTMGGIERQDLGVSYKTAEHMFRSYHVGLPSSLLGKNRVTSVASQRRSEAKRDVPVVEQCTPSCFVWDLGTTARCDAITIALYGLLTGHSIRRAEDGSYEIRKDDSRADGVLRAVLRQDRGGPWKEKWLPAEGIVGDACLIILQPKELLVFEGEIRPSDDGLSTTVPRRVPDATRYVIPIDVHRALRCWSNEHIENSDYDASLEGFVLRLARALQGLGSGSTHGRATDFVNLHHRGKFEQVYDDSKLRAYQQNIVQYCERNFDASDPLGGGALILMGMGLGKTITGLVLAQQIATKIDVGGRDIVLVLAPKVVIDGGTFQRTARDLNLDHDEFSTSTREIVRSIDDIAATKKMVLVSHSKVSHGKTRDVDAIVSALQRAHEAGRTVVVIVDEAHHLRDTGRLKKLNAFCARIATYARFRILMTGTPYVNTAHDLDALLNIASNRTVELDRFWSCAKEKRVYMSTLNVSIAWMMTRVSKFPIQINKRHGVPMHDAYFEQLRMFYKRNLKERVRSEYDLALRSDDDRIDPTFITRLRETLHDWITSPIGRINVPEALRRQIVAAFEQYDKDVKASQGRRNLIKTLLKTIKIDWTRDEFWSDSRWIKNDNNAFLHKTRRFSFRYGGAIDDDIAFYENAVELEDDDVDWPTVPTADLTCAHEAHHHVEEDLPKCFEKALQLLVEAIDKGSLPIVFHCSVVEVGVSKFYEEMHRQRQTKYPRVSSFTYGMISFAGVRIGEHAASIKDVLSQFERGLIDVLVFSNKASEGLNLRVLSTLDDWDTHEEVDGTFVSRNVDPRRCFNNKRRLRADLNDESLPTHKRRVQPISRSALTVETSEFRPDDRDGTLWFVHKDGSRSATDQAEFELKPVGTGRHYIQNRVPPVRQFCHLSMDWHFASMHQAQARVIREDSHPTVFDGNGSRQHPFARGEVHVHTIVTERADDELPLCQTEDEKIELAAHEKMVKMEMRAEQLSMNLPETECKDAFTLRLQPSPGWEDAVVYKGVTGIGETKAPDRRGVDLESSLESTRLEGLLDRALEGTGLEGREANISATGKWSVDFSSVSATEWLRVRDRLGVNLNRLYHEGLLRYAAWI